MGIVKRRGQNYYWVKRVPKRYAGFVLSANGNPVQQVRQSLNTDSKTEALAKAAQVESERLAEWECLLAGDHGTAREHYEAARKLAAAYGFTYRPLSELPTVSVREIVDRTNALSELSPPAPLEVSLAVGGVVPPTLPDLDGAFQDYLEFTRDRHLQKSESQKKKWRRPRETTIKNFQKIAYGNGKCPPMNEITRADALKFRAWWSARVEGGLSANSANKQFDQLREIFTTWSNLAAPGLDNPFSGLSLKRTEMNRTPPFTQTWIKDHILAPGALANLNDEAADVLLVLINTGLRPSEVTDASGIPVIQFNRTPRIKDEDPGTRRRLVFMPLEVKLHELPPDKRKSPIESERELEAELSGILNWMLDGFRDFQARVDAGQGVPLGIDPPKSMLDLKDRIMESADPVGTFLRECADIEPKGRTRTAEFFRAFKAWARDVGARVYSDAALRDNLTEKGFPKMKTNGVMCFSGFSWKDDDLVRTYLADFGPIKGQDGYSQNDFS